MPEVEFGVRWPDGSRSTYVSPSRAIREQLVAGASYPLDEFVRRAKGGLEAASERVRENYGYACTAAAAECEALGSAAARMPHGAVAVESLDVRSRRRARAIALPSHVSVAVVGGGQAGLSISHCLAERGIDHIVLERSRACHSWSDERWDSFCLVTPNWQCRLPDFPYAGSDPDGFMVREEISGYLDAYIERDRPPLIEGVGVSRVGAAGEGFVLETSAGELEADQVVLAVGGYHEPLIPRIAERLPARMTQLHSSSYRNPGSIPDGATLVVGTGQSGCQIAEDLHIAGREVHVAVGSAPRVARRYRGRDVVAWLEEIGHYKMPVGQHSEGEEQARHEPNHYVTGRDGGHDIDLRAMAREGVGLHGRLSTIFGESVSFDPDLERNLDSADATAERIKDTIDEYIGNEGIDAPEEERYSAVWRPPHESPGLDLGASRVNTVIWSTGFRSDWGWIRLPAFDGSGYPVHERGVTSVEGLYVLGLPWLHTWGSGRFAGIEVDSTYLTDRIAERAASVEPGLTARAA